MALLRGADKAGLEEKIKQFYTDASQDEEVGVKGMVIKTWWFLPILSKKSTFSI